MKTPPTSAQFQAYEAMFAYFNGELWGGRLPPVILNFSRHAGALGFFAPERWENGKERTHEISINPAFLLTRSPREVASTLVHEMTHHWQKEFGKPSRGGYHNREWAAEMKRVGLHPSSTAAPGGDEVGQRVSHYIVEGGPFDVAFQKMPEACTLPWRCAAEPGTARAKTRKNKRKYTCPACGTNAWGCSGLVLQCASYEHEEPVPMDEELADEADDGTHGARGALPEHLGDPAPHRRAGVLHRNALAPEHLADDSVSRANSYPA